MLQLSAEKVALLECQPGISSLAHGGRRRSLPYAFTEHGVEEDPDPRAAGYCSSVRPCTRPVAISSIRRTPSLMASFKEAGVTTLSIRRRANSSRTSVGPDRLRTAPFLHRLTAGCTPALGVPAGFVLCRRSRPQDPAAGAWQCGQILWTPAPGS